MSVEITKAQQVSEEMASADMELLDEELDTVAGGLTVNGGISGGNNTFVENNGYKYESPKYPPCHYPW